MMKNTYPKRFSRVDEVAQWIRRLAIGTDLSLIPRTHVLEGENWLPKVVLTFTYMSWHTSTYIHTSKRIHIKRSGFTSRPSRVHLKKCTKRKCWRRQEKSDGRHSASYYGSRQVMECHIHSVLTGCELRILHPTKVSALLSILFLW